MLEIDHCVLVVVDVQGKLARLMAGTEALFKNIQILIQAAKILEVPIVWCQQVPASLGPTIPEIAELLADGEPIDKASFSCCGAERFNVELEKLDKQQILLCGIETHVCIYQTAVDLMTRGLDVTVIGDAVSSRTEQNKRIGLSRITAAGATVASVEMALFELLKTAEHPRFRQIAGLVK